MRPTEFVYYQLQRFANRAATPEGNAVGRDGNAVRRIPMSEEGRRLAAKREARMIRWGKIGVLAAYALAGVLLVMQL